MTRAAGGARGGYAMLVVLLTLMALFVLCAPFLVTVRNADQASQQDADRVSAELALDAAERLARARLGASHPALDRTPYHDSLEELAVENRFDAGFLDANDPHGVMFDLESHDVSARIDLDSAPPQCLANVIGGTAVTVEAVEPDATSIRVSTTAGFLPEGFVWIEGELIGYASIEGNELKGLARGLGATTDESGDGSPCGPRPPQAIAAGAVVVDQRAEALALWRTLGPADVDGGWRGFDAPERVQETLDLVLAGELGVEARAEFERACTTHAGVAAGARWQRPTRVTNALEAGADCDVFVEDGRWFNAGATVLLTDGRSSEIALVRDASGGKVTLTGAVRASYAAYAATLSPLARRPVNVNTASEEVLYALCLNLKLRGRQARIAPGEARALAAAIVESRPFTSFEDFARRLALPAGGLEPLPEDAPVVPEAFRAADGATAAICDADDARALYKNALNANDAELAFSTMPFAFTSTDVHAMDLRAAVNAGSGVERARARREEVQLVVPQQDLMFVASRQEDFEALFRLDRDAAGWATGPWNTSRFDRGYRSSPPSRARAHLDVHDTLPPVDDLGETEPVFAARDEEDEDGFAMPWAARLEDQGLLAGRVLHFDDERRGLEGRDLADGRVELAADDARVAWVGGGGLMRPFSFSLWIRPRALVEGTLFVDAGGAFTDADRASLLIEGGDLVLRVLDAGGDHPTTTFEERGEARYPLAQGDGPGMPLDTWIHVAADVRGNRPDQITLVVDGRMDATTPGLTRLTSALGDQDAVIPVESTEGFPDVCVLRIGAELIEAVKSGPTTFSATYASTGVNAGFGGRLARVEFTGVEPGIPDAVEFVTTPGQYPSGTPVELYGYSLRLASNVPAGSGQLASALGAFAVGRVVPGEGMEEITITAGDGSSFTVGMGLETQQQASLKLVPVDPGVTVQQLMSAFDPGGGYALLANMRTAITVRTFVPPTLSTEELTTAGLPLGGWEVVRYSGWSGDTLHVLHRMDAITLPDLGGADLSGLLGGKAAFVFEWGNVVTGEPPVPVDTLLTWHTKVFPISTRVAGANALDPFAQGSANSAANPRVAQITRLGADSGLTEWVRYDFNDPNGGHLVREDPQALADAFAAVQAGQTEIEESQGTVVTPGGGGGGIGQPGGGGGGGGGAPAPPPKALLAAAPPSAPAAPPALDGPSWHPRIGEDEHEQQDHYVARAVRSALQHRGVMDTFDHAHPAGAMVLPVWKAVDEGVDAGRPGRFDAVMLIDPSPTQPGFPGVVQRAHRPTEYTRYAWQMTPGDAMTPAPGAGAGTVVQPKELADRVLVALQDELGVPFAPGQAPADDPAFLDTRVLARVAKFPSGELPRAVSSVAVGGGAAGPGGVPDAIVDEVAFGDTRLGIVEPLRGAQLVLQTAVGPTDDVLSVVPNAVRIPYGVLAGGSPPPLSLWPADAGLLRVGDEILCYEGYDAGSGTLAIATGGRGLLGTDPGPHAAGEEIALLEPFAVTVLAAGAGARDALLVGADLAEFPLAGLVRVDDELVHYTRHEGPALAMPAAASEPGRADGRGPGIFRGRFGTEPAGHAAGTPVVLHPFRYWDRWADRADAPEMHYLGVHVDQPAAFWRTAFFDVLEAGVQGPRLGALQRTDPRVPWDADPDEEDDLDLLLDGLREGRGNAVGRQSDRIEWRVFVRYEPGSFDPALGFAHGWKTAPRLSYFGAEYLAPGFVLRRVAR